MADAYSQSSKVRLNYISPSFLWSTSSGPLTVSPLIIGAPSDNTG